MLNARLSLSVCCGKLGMSGGGFSGVYVGGKTGGAVAARRADRWKGGLNKIVVT